MFGHSMQAGADNVHTRKIAEFVSTLSYDRIPGEVRERIKLLILDALGCGLYGAQLEWCRILQSTLKALDSTRTTSVWGTPLRLSSPHAALPAGADARRSAVHRVRPDAAGRESDAAGADTSPVTAMRTRQHWARGSEEKQHQQCGPHEASPFLVSPVESWNGSRAASGHVAAPPSREER
jgi:hypothetical protein